MVKDLKTYSVLFKVQKLHIDDTRPDQLQVFWGVENL